MGGIKYLINRKPNSRKAEAEADSVEFNVLRETVEFLQQQFKGQRRTIFPADRNSPHQNAEILELTKAKGQVELELQKYRCVVAKCPKREPQNGY
jgi:hypothetical protein